MAYRTIEIVRKAKSEYDEACTTGLNLASIKVNGVDILPMVEHLEFSTGTQKVDQLILTLRGKIVITDED